MNESRILYVGLDVRKDIIDIALADVARDGEVRHVETVAGGTTPVTKVMRQDLIPAAASKSLVAVRGSTDETANVLTIPTAS